MRKTVFWMLTLCLLLVSFTALAQTAYVNGATADRVHMRNASSARAESMGLFFNGTEVEALYTQGEWTRVNVGALSGYIMSCYLEQHSDHQAQYSGLLQVSTLNMRAEPSMQAKVIRVLDETDSIAVWGQTSDGWYYVECDGVPGYVRQEYLALAEMIPMASDVMRVGWAHDGYGIFRWFAPNGQEILFTALEDDPWIKWEDVNFDGHDDVVITTVRGASNFLVEFYVWQDGQYVYANQGGVYDSLCNYALYPELGLVFSGSNNGHAGSLHENVLYAWDGTQLKMLRKAVSEEYTEMIGTPDLPMIR